MKALNKKFISVYLFIMCGLVLSCCKSTYKKVEDNLKTEENVVREISNKNFMNNDNRISIETIDSIVDGNTVSGRINVVYKDMIQNMKKIEATYSAAYTVENMSSGSFPWMESLIDDEKYFYAIGASEICKGRAAAKKFAELDAEAKLKSAAIQISGDKNIDVHAWRLLKVCYKKIINRKDGRTYYSASVLIGVNRNLVVKN